MNVFSFDRLAAAPLWRAALVAAMGWLPFSTATTQAANSSIVGFYNVTVPVGNSAWVSGLVGADVYQGTAASVTADVDGKALVTFTLPGWSGGDFPLHYAEPQSGSGTGLALDILSNTTDTLKLNTTPAAAGLTNGMVFIIRKHATLRGLLPDGGGFQPFQDTITLIGPDGAQKNYFFNSLNSTWIDVLLNDASNVVVRPGQGFIFQVGAPLTVTLGKGEIAYVKTTATQITATAKVPNLTGALNPLNASTTLISLGILGNLQPFNDSVVTLNPGNFNQTGTFLSDGTDYRDSFFNNADSFALPTGVSVVVDVDTTKNLILSPVVVGP